MQNRLQNRGKLIGAPTTGLAGCAFFFASALLVLAPPSFAETPPDPALRGWARTFAVQFCPRDCSRFRQEADEAQEAVNALPPNARPTEANLAIRARAQIAPRDYEACARRASTERDVFIHEAAQLDCAHVLALTALPARCASELEGRAEVCRAEEASARARAEALVRAQEEEKAAALAALRRDQRLMVITYSAALCVYADARTRLTRTRVGSSVAPLLSGVMDEDQKPAVRLQRVEELTQRTRSQLKSEWHVPPLPCTDNIVSHVADCLWLEDFAALKRDHPGTLAPELCADELSVRANRVGYLLPLPKPVEDPPPPPETSAP